MKEKEKETARGGREKGRKLEWELLGAVVAASKNRGCVDSSKWLRNAGWERGGGAQKRKR